MFWAYVIIALAVVAGGVTAVETYNHALTSSANANQVAANASQRAAQAERSKVDLQELVDHADALTKTQKQELADQDERLRTMDGKIRAGAAKDPKGYACESTAVPSAVRELRRATFGAPASAGVLHPASPAPADAAPAASGRDVRPGEAGGGPGPQAAPLVQQRQVDSAPAAGEAKPAAQSIRDRLKALMGRTSKGTP